MCTLVRDFEAFFDNSDDHHDSVCLSHWTGLVLFAYIEALHVDEPHDRYGDDFGNGESHPSASDAAAGHSLTDCVFTSKNNANKVPV